MKTFLFTGRNKHMAIVINARNENDAWRYLARAIDQCCDSDKAKKIFKILATFSAEQEGFIGTIGENYTTVLNPERDKWFGYKLPEDTIFWNHVRAYNLDDAIGLVSYFQGMNPTTVREKFEFLETPPIG